MHKPEERPDFAEINQELQSKVGTWTIIVVLSAYIVPVFTTLLSRSVSYYVN